MTRLRPTRCVPGDLLAAWSAARRVVPWVVLVCALALPVANLRGESERLNKLFENVPGGQVVQAAAYDDSAPFADDSANDSSAGANQLTQPNSMSGGRQLLMPSANSPATAGEILPAPKVEGMLPIGGSDGAGEVQMSQSKEGLISLVVRDASLSRVLALLAQTQGLNIIAANDIDASISITVRDVSLEDAMTAILSVANYTWVRKNNIILITSLVDSANLAADVQGRQIEVFDLDFASATEVAKAVTEFMSPIGKVTTTESDPTDNRKTREVVVVEDLPERLSRISAYIHCIDRPPRQVLIEAHILQVNLDDVNKQGVDLKALARCANQNLAFETVGLASAAASPAVVATLEGADLDTVIELVQTSTDSKNLGSPKVLVLNEQEAKIQVGEQIGYQGSQTTTQTSTFQSVQFLEVGVVLRLTPRITRDGRVLLHVKPEVSTGKINPATSVPDKSTTELETNIMLNDGQGMVIGGLIKEIDQTVQTKIPYLGDVKGLGWFFRRSEVTKTRVEVIIALLPRIQPYAPDYQAYEQGELVNAGVQLFHGPLCRTYRPWDAILPDGKRVYRPLCPRPNNNNNNMGGPVYGMGPDYQVPPHPLPEQHFYNGPCGPGDQAPMPGPQTRPFLSDESRQTQGAVNGAWEPTEIISDHP